MDDPAAVLDAANARAVVVVALAHAGWAAIELRRRCKGRIRGIVSVEWFVLGAPQSFLDALQGKQSPERWRQVVDATFDHWLQGADNPELVRFVREGMGAFSFPMWSRAAREISAAFDREPVPLDALGRLDVPVLHLYSQPRDQAYLDAQQEFSRMHPWFSVQRLQLGLPPELTQTVKTLFAVRWKSLDRQDDCTAYWGPAGEAEAGSGGDQPAKE